MSKSIRRLTTRQAFLLVTAVTLTAVFSWGAISWANPVLDTTPPTATVTHDGVTKTITYTFSEPIQLISQADGAFTPLARDLLGIYVIDGSGNYGPNKVVGAQILTANYASEVLIITYAGFLAQSVDTSYVVDAWGYSITDLAGNRIILDATQIFTVAGDTVTPTTSDNYGAKNNVWQRLPNIPEIALTPSDPATSSGIAWTKYCTTPISGGCLINDANGFAYTGAPVQIFTEGTTYFRYASKDNAGNVQTVVERIVKFDRSGLQSSRITSPAPHSVVRGIVNITADATDTVSGMDKVEFHLLSGVDLKIGEDNEAPYELSWNTLDSVVGAVDGNYMLMIKAFDNAGNMLQSDQVAVTVDNTAPTASISYDITAPTKTNVVAKLITPSEPIIITNNGGLDTYTFTVNGIFTFTFVDAAGNTGSATATVANIDKVAPVITIVGDNPASVALGTTYTDAGATALDAFAGATTVVMAGTVNTATLGAYTITYTATDTAGNVATAARIVNVVADPLSGLPPTAKSKPGTRAWYVAQGWHYIASLKERDDRAKEGYDVRLLEGSYYWK